MSAPATPRRDWKYKDAAKEFHARHGYTPYTMIPNAVLEADMLDRTLPKELRVLAAIRRFAWGNLSDWAVDAMPAVDPTDPKPRPFNNTELAARIGMPLSTFSETVSALKRSGALRPDHPYLYPDDKSQPSLFASLKAPSDQSNCLAPDSDITFLASPSLRLSYSQFRVGYLADNTDLATSIDKAAAERDRLYSEARAAAAEVRALDRKILNAYRAWKRQNGVDSDFEGGAGSDGAKAPSESPKPVPPTVIPDSNCAGTDSDSTVKRFATPPDPVRDSTGAEFDSRRENRVTPSVCNADDEPLLTTESLIKGVVVTPTPIPPPKEVTTTTPSESVEPILESFAPHGLIAEKSARKLVAECRAKAPDATVEEIAAVVTETRVSKSVETPIGFLLKAVPAFFAGGEALARWRGKRKAAETPPDRFAEQKRRSDAEFVAKLRAQWDQLTEAERATALDAYPELAESPPGKSKATGGSGGES